MITEATEILEVMEAAKSASSLLPGLPASGYAEPGDLLLLGARTLEGLNLTIEPGRKRLVAAGPLPAASPTSPRLASRSTRTR